MDDHGLKTCVQLPRAEVIARLNDVLRETGTGGSIVVTKAVTHLPRFDAAALMAALANYEGFDADNDPHGDHDFGSFEVAGERFFWKIDYYDRNLEYGSDDPADPSKTTRVLTLMLALEY